jgi:hypothetical protein
VLISLNLLDVGGLLAASTSTANKDDSPPVLLIIIGALVGLGIWSSARSREKDRNAKARIASLSVDELHEVEYKLLVALRSGTQRLCDLTPASGEDSRTTKWLIAGLIDSDYVELVPTDATIANDDAGEDAAQPATLEETSTIRLTEGGRRRLREPREITRVGDYFNQVNSTYIRESTVSNSFNHFRVHHDEEMASALARFTEAVRVSGNEEATELAAEFLNQAEAEKPNTLVMKSLFESVLRAVPAVATMTDVVVKIRELLA